MAAQDGVVQTRVYSVKIMGEPGTLYSRRCGEKRRLLATSSQAAQATAGSSIKKDMTKVSTRMITRSLGVRLPEWLRGLKGTVRGGIIKDETDDNRRPVCPNECCHREQETRYGGETGGRKENSDIRSGSGVGTNSHKS